MPILHNWRAVLALIVCLVAQISARPGESTFSAGGYVEFIEGNLPILVVVPHGGLLRPLDLPDRGTAEGEDVAWEAETIKVGRALTSEMAYITNGSWPWVAICHLHRMKVDVDSPFAQGTEGLPESVSAWNAYHNFINATLHHFKDSYGYGQLFEIRGQSHPSQAVEFGFGVPLSALNANDQTLGSPDVISQSTISGLVVTQEQFVAMIRGERSLGGFLQDLGWKALPSDHTPNPGDVSAFNDGSTYTMQTYGSIRLRTILNAVQISVNREIRTGTPDVVRDQFSRDLANVTISWFNAFYTTPIAVVYWRADAGAPEPVDNGTTVGDVFAIIFAVLLAVGIFSVSAWIVWAWRKKRAENVTNVQ